MDCTGLGTTKGAEIATGNEAGIAGDGVVRDTVVIEIGQGIGIGIWMIGSEKWDQDPIPVGIETMIGLGATGLDVICLLEGSLISVMATVQGVDHMDHHRGVDQYLTSGVDHLLHRGETRWGLMVLLAPSTVVPQVQA